MLLSKWTTAVIVISALGLALLAFAAFIEPSFHPRRSDTSRLATADQTGQLNRIAEELPVDESGFPAPVRMLGVDAGNTAFIQAPGVPAQNRIYYRLAGEDVTPVIAGDTVYLSSEKVIAYELKTGLEKWHFDLPAPAFPYAAVSDTAVYVACKQTMYAIGRTSGRLLWRARLKGDLTSRSRPILAGELVVVGTSYGILGFDQHEGRSRLMFPNDSILCLAAEGDTLFAGGRDLYAFDLKTLALRWERFKSGYVLIAKEGAIYYHDWNKHVIRMAPETGDILWTIDIKGELRGMTPAGRRIFIGTTEGPLTAYDIETGKEVWRVDLPVAGPINAFCIAGERIYATTMSESHHGTPDTLFVTDVRTGQMIWKMEYCSGRPVVYGDMVFASSSKYGERGLVAIGPGSISSCTEMTSLQDYVNAVNQLYEQGEHYWNEAQALAVKGLKQWPQGTITHVYKDNVYKGAPYLLDILAKIYRHRGNFAAALRCYRRMYREYPKDKYETGDGETQSQLFISGAEGLSGEAFVLREGFRDYATSIRVAYALMNEYGSEKRWGYEHYDSYWWIAQGHIHESLKKINPPIERWEIEYRRLQSKAIERPDIAALWLKLAGYFSKTDRFQRAIALYNDVRMEFADFYRLSDYGDEVWCPALNACRELAAIYETLKYPPEECAAIAHEIRIHEEKAAEILKKGLAGD